jgi:hypothetical protein
VQLKDWMRVFLAFAALIGGAVCLVLGFPALYLQLSGSGVVIVGALLFAGSATYFRMNKVGKPVAPHAAHAATKKGGSQASPHQVK